MVRKVWVASCALVGFLAHSAHSHAAPATANVIQLGIGFRYGFEMNDGDFNPWGVGIGLDAGLTLPNAIYLGGNFDYFFGESVEFDIPELGVEGEGSANIWQLMAEGGYDVGLGDHFVVRPKLGVGLASLNAESCTTVNGSETCDDQSETNFAIAPGATLLFLSNSFSLSVDLRYDIIFAGEDNPHKNALLLSAGIGF